MSLDIPTKLSAATHGISLLEVLVSLALIGLIGVALVMLQAHMTMTTHELLEQYRQELSGTYFHQPQVP